MAGVGTARDFFQAPCLGGLTPDKGTGCLFDLNPYLYGNVVAFLRYWNVYGEHPKFSHSVFLYKKFRPENVLT
jgi:hypothetical protein